MNEFGSQPVLINLDVYWSECCSALYNWLKSGNSAEQGFDFVNFTVEHGYFFPYLNGKQDLVGTYHCS